MHAKAFVAETVLAERRGELIEKHWSRSRPLICWSPYGKRIMNLSQTYARRMVGLKMPAQASKMLREMAISVLNEIKDLPSKVVDDNWLEKVEEGDV